MKRVALILFVLALALTFRFSDEARYLIIPVGLTLPLAASLYRWPVVTGAVAGLAALTLVFAHAENVLKPSGLDGRDPVWSLPRHVAMTLDVPARGPLIAAVEEQVPAEGRLGAVLAPSDWDYPLYGRGFDRKLVPLTSDRPFAEAERRGLRWVVFGHDRRPQRAGWQTRRFERAGTLADRQ